MLAQIRGMRGWTTLTPARAANCKRCSCASCRVASGGVTEEYAGTSDVAMGVERRSVRAKGSDGNGNKANYG